MHHAVAAGDAATIAARRPARAAREAARAGSHRQALAHFESVLPHLDRLAPRERAAVLDDYGWELYNAHRFREAVEAGPARGRAVRRAGRRGRVGECLVRVSRHLFMAGRDRRRRGLRAARGGGARAHGRRGRARPRDALPGRDPGDDRRAGGGARRRSRTPAGSRSRPGAADLAALALNYLGIACFEVGETARGWRCCATASPSRRALRRHEYVARGYCNLAELLGRAGRLDELDAAVADGLRFARERGFWSHAYNLEVQRCTALVRRGRWEHAAAACARSSTASRTRAC